MPILSGILAATAIAGTAAAGVGVAEQAKSQGIQQQGETDQNKIAQQEMADKQKTYDAANAFYTPYTQSGSPFLAQQQSQAAGQNAQQTNNAAGAVRSEMGSTGLGFGPSGATAAGLAGVGSESAATGASNYLQNLLQNEQIKFQAQQGLINAGTMAGSTQNQPSVSTQIPAASTTGAIGAAGQTLAGALGGGGTNAGEAINNVGAGTLGIPQPGTIPTTNVQTPSVLTPPGTQGWNI